MSANIGQGRLLRVCDLCGGVDDHPRHVIAGAGGGTEPVVAAPSEEILNRVLDAAPTEERARLVRDLMDTSTSDRHMDCCRSAGGPDGTCHTVTAGAEDKRGSALLKHLVAKSKEN